METSIEIPKKAFNDAYIDFMDCASRFLIFYGGAGSGKSYFIAQRYLVNMMQRPLLNLLVVRAVSNTNRDSTFALFKQIINLWGLSQLFKINESDMRITCINGNSAIFKGLDDTEKLKSITFAKGQLSDIWIEEASETEEADFNQLNIRLRGAFIDKQIVISFNPVNINHWLKKRFFDKKDDRVTILHTTYKDNKFLDEEYKEILEGYKDTDPYYYAVYCLGQWGVYGQSIFDKQKISERLEKIKEPIKTGYFEFGKVPKWIDDPNGAIKIYKEPAFTPYVIGGDTSGDGSDYFTGQVIDNNTGEQVAVLRQQFDEDLYARQMYCLGIYYNIALLGIETNFSTYPIKQLEKFKYTKMYVRKREDTFTGKTVNAYGFKTTAKTRPLLIAELVTLVRDNVDLINDRATLEELLTFVRNEKGKPEAMNGSHDDLVISLGIAHYIRPQQDYAFLEPPEKPVYNFSFEKPKPDASGMGEEVKII